MESGWSFKHLHKLIVTSRAYRMRSSESGPDDPNVKIDPDNRYVWRTNLKRMEGEVVRDSVLFLAGRLDPKIGGPDQPVADAETGTRRTIYYRYASGDNIPFLTMFDAANVTECYRRHETIVPQQALAMINSGMVLDSLQRHRGCDRPRSGERSVMPKCLRGLGFRANSQPGANRG